jgi:putative flavoprotein involved in K+ transport
MSRCLCDRSIDHVVFERGEIAHTWRTERWDSLRLLTPNWQSRLPAFHYDGNDPDGYRTVTEVIEFIASYAKAISAPVLTNTTVTSVRSTEAGYLVRTDQDDWLCRAVVIASGACNVADVPSFANKVPRPITQLTAQDYRNPEQLEWWRLGRRRILERYSDRPRNTSLGPPGYLVGGRAYSSAARLSWQRLRVVDGCRRRARRAL